MQYHAITNNKGVTGEQGALKGALHNAIEVEQKLCQTLTWIAVSSGRRGLAGAAVVALLSRCYPTTLCRLVSHLRTVKLCAAVTRDRSPPAVRVGGGCGRAVRALKR